LAELPLNETSENTGAADGNVLPTETVLLRPLTEIVAVFALEKLSFLAGFEAAGLGRPDAIFAGPDLAVVELPPEPEAHTTPGAWLDAATQPVEICCLNGSLLLNWLKETS
jgi:hypothetical protein